MAGKHVRLTCHWSICTVVVCMIVRFKPKITRSFFLLASSIRILLLREEKLQERPLGPEYVQE